MELSATDIVGSTGCAGRVREARCSGEPRAAVHCAIARAAEEPRATGCGGEPRAAGALGAVRGAGETRTAWKPKGCRMSRSVKGCQSTRGCQGHRRTKGYWKTKGWWVFRRTNSCWGIKGCQGCTSISLLYRGDGGGRPSSVMSLGVASVAGHPHGHPASPIGVGSLWEDTDPRSPEPLVVRGGWLWLIWVVWWTT